MAAVVDIVAIREALAGAAEALGLYAYAYPQASPAVGPAGTFVVTEPDDEPLIEYHETGDGGVIVRLIGQVLVGSVANEAGMRLLDTYRGTRHALSLADALDAAVKADNAADYVTVRDFSGFSAITYGDQATGAPVYYGAQCRIEVYA